jgi:raffinose/stachyose/melibiose transport system permease protein
MTERGRSTPTLREGTVSVEGARLLPTGQPAARRRRRNPSAPPLSIYLFPLPALIVFFVFFVMPTIQGFQYAVTDWDGFSPDYNTVGMGNFVNAITNDNLFAGAAVNNVKFLLVVVIVQTLFSLVLALAVLKNTRGNVLLRALFFLPTILSSVSVAFIWKFVYDPTYGLGNQLLRGVAEVASAVGIQMDPVQLSYLGNEQAAIFWVAVAQCWAHIGQMMVIYVAGLQSIPGEFYEAAEVDGAGPWQRFRHITWPQVAPATAIIVAYTTVQSFKAFDLILGLSGIPPKASMDILSTRIYTTFANSQYGYAAAESIIFMLLIAVLTWMQRRGLKFIQRNE